MKRAAGGLDRRGHSAKWLWLVAIAAALAVAIAVFDWNWLRGPAASYLSHRIGRPVTIGGLHVDLALHPRVVLDDVSVGNAAWSDQSVMARASRVAARLDLRSLWRRPAIFDEVALERADVLLEKGADGKANWDFGGGSRPVIEALAVHDGVLRYRDPRAAADVTLRLDSSAPASDATPIAFSGAGTLRGNALRVEGTAASLLALENGDRPYRLDVRARAGATRAHFDGTVVPERIEDLRGSFSLEGPDLSQLYPLIPVPLPWTPGYSLHGQLAHGSAIWSFRGFAGKVGESDLAGDFALDNSQPRSRITADVVSSRLDYKDLGGFVGLPAGGSADAANTSAQQSERRRREASARALPSKPYDLGRLRAVDAKVTFKGKRFITTDLPLDNLDVGLDLENGVLKLEPLDFGIAGGHVVADITLDARKDVIATSADIRAHDVELKQVVPALKPPNGSAGKLAGRAVFTAHGNSVGQMLSSSDGEAALISRGGDASALAIVLTNLDLAHAIPLLLTRSDEKAPIRCVVADVAAAAGLMTTKSLVVDTSTEKIFGAGTIDFRNERYDVSLKAQSKQPSLLALRGPIVIDGSFKSPHVHPAIAQVAARIGAAVALGALAPPAAILPFIDFGHATDANCEGLMQAALQNVEPGKHPAQIAAEPKRSRGG
jgi:uncharacterized protein involved in outer membrane biogenesis